MYNYMLTIPENERLEYVRVRKFPIFDGTMRIRGNCAEFKTETTRSRFLAVLQEEKEKAARIAEIKSIIDKGITVYADSDNYIAGKDNKGQYLIAYKQAGNHYCTGLHGKEGTIFQNDLNAREFYTKGIDGNKRGIE